MDLSEIVQPLLHWYSEHARVLPWRDEPTPYRVWVSEIMLQQTRVEAVIPYFERFLAELPTLEALADAEEPQLLKLWEGLGYYSRVRNLHKAAQTVMREYGGVLPQEPEVLAKLPGIGAYTAGAIASIAYGRPAPAVDGNVLRVIARVTANRGNVSENAVKRSMERDLKQIYPPDRAGDFTQALMELGALVCLPNGAPKCEECPLFGLCSARMQNCTDELPVKAAKKERKIEQRTVFLIVCGGKAAIRKRPEHGLLAGLWEFPSADGTLSKTQAQEWLAERGLKPEKLERLPKAKHIFSHVEWHMTGYLTEVPEIPGQSGLTPAERDDLLQTYTLPTAFKAFLSRYMERDEI